MWKKLSLVGAALLLIAAAANVPPQVLYTLAGIWKVPQTFQAGANINNQIIAQTKHDEITGTDGIIAANSTIFGSATASFTNQDRGKTIIVNGAGSAGTDLITTIASIVDATHVILANAATYATPWWTVGRAYHASTADVSASYAIGDTLTVSGGTTIGGASGIFTIISLEVSTPTVAAGGSGGTNGPCTVMGTTGVTRTTWLPTTINGGATPISAANGWFTASGTVSGGALTGPLTIVQGGDYSTAPTVQSAEPVVPYVGCAGLTGATVSLKMGPHMVQQTTPGHYAALPTNPAATTTNGSGAGATLTLWGLSATGYSITAQGDQVGGYYAYGTDDTAAINSAIAQAQAGAGGTVVFPAGRSLMLGAFNIPYIGTTPPMQPPLRLTGAGRLAPQSFQGGYFSAYAGGNMGTIIDNRYAGGDGAGHVAKIDTRGMGQIEVDHFSLVDWGTDNFLMLQTTNTWPNIHDVSFLGNPTCYEMTCAQNAIRLGGITGNSPISTNAANAAYQNNSPRIADNLFGHISEGIQFGAAANSALIANNQADSTDGNWTTGFIHLYGAALTGHVSGGTGGNTFLGNEVEMLGYPYALYADHVDGVNGQNTIFGLAIFDGSLLRGAGKNGTPTLGGFFFDSASNYNVVHTSCTNELVYSFVTQSAGNPNNSFYCDYGPVPNFVANSQVVHGLLGVGLGPNVNPTYPVDVGNGTGGVSSRVNGGNTNSNDGPCVRVSAASVDRITIGTYSGFRGGAADATGVINANGGRIKFESFNNDIFTLDNGFLSMQAPFQLMNYTVGTLPTCNSGAKGRTVYVTDASAPTYNATLSGSGASIVKAFCNGTNWVGG